MRFRYVTMSDIPECVKLYQQMNEEHRPEELPYPLHTEQTDEEFTLSMARQLCGNPAWFAIAGVVGSTLKTDIDGNKQVVGGKVKGYISIGLSQRSVGEPKNVAFIELLVVDRNFRKRDVARKLVHLGTVESAKRGAQVIEAAYNPNSLGSEMWPAFGLKPYRVLGAWVLDDGTPRSDLPMPKKPQPESTEAPAPKRRGRPPKE